MIKLLAIFPRELYERKMSFVRRHAIETFQEMADEHALSVRLSGPHWPDWHDDQPLRDQLDGANAILWYKPDDVKQPQDHPGAVAMVCYNEAWWDNGAAQAEVERSGADVVVCHHREDMRQFRNTADRLVVHVPHAAKESLFKFYRRQWRGRYAPVLLTGVLSKEFYPLRARYAELIRRGDITGVIKSHPGYRLASLEECRVQEHDYADELGRARVVICTGSRFNYGLAKYVEAAMAGCVIVGDAPPDFAHSFGRLIYSVTSDCSDQQLIDAVWRATTLTESEWTHRSKQLAALAARHHEMGRYCRVLLGIFRQEIFRRGLDIS